MLQFGQQPLTRGNFEGSHGWFNMNLSCFLYNAGQISSRHGIVVPYKEVVQWNWQFLVLQCEFDSFKLFEHLGFVGYLVFLSQLD